MKIPTCLEDFWFKTDKSHFLSYLYLATAYLPIPSCLLNYNTKLEGRRGERTHRDL